MRVPFHCAAGLAATLLSTLFGCTPVPRPDLWFVADPADVTLAVEEADPERIVIWRDRVAGVEAVTGATPDARPRLSRGDDGGRHSVEFGGMLGFETGPIPALETDTLCAYLVGRRPEVGPAVSWYLSAAYRSGAGSELESRRMWSLRAGPDGWLSATAGKAGVGEGPVVSRAPPPVDGGQELVEMCWTGDDELQLAVNGERHGGTGGADAVPAGHTHLYLGTSGEHQHLRGEIAEVRIFGRDLTVPERRAVTSELAANHGIPLPRSPRTAVYMVLGCTGVLGAAALVTFGGRRRSRT